MLLHSLHLLKPNSYVVATAAVLNLLHSRTVSAQQLPCLIHTLNLFVELNYESRKYYLSYYNHLNKIVSGVSENRDKAKQGLVTLELVFTRKIAETQNLIC